ncbi:hypothetical protein PJWF_00054 [Achromobacter phage JWF]|uniref:hypothetical protein n=1 Tax=Achromobacter phage JWF TaxID=1589748 RepID=UPI000588E647|nr:hypothetical protein AXJ13_gp054 [Achromobacter phage JWF]AJD82948.1 hypothetical protein PJWF_00054 [Achromobacter phage JWF]
MTPNIPALYYLIEDGQALELVQAHIRDVIATDGARHALIKEISDEAQVENAYRHVDTGVLLGVTFARGHHHPDFTKPRGRNKTCHPKQGTFWEKRFKEQPKIETLPRNVVDAYKIPLTLNYVKIENGKETEEGFRHIGWPPLHEVGFLYLGKAGPYALWTPDIVAYARAQEAKGYKVKGECAVWNQDGLEGCRRIKKEEWELLVAQHNLDAANKGESDDSPQ